MTQPFVSARCHVTVLSPGVLLEDRRGRGMTGTGAQRPRVSLGVWASVSSDTTWRPPSAAQMSFVGLKLFIVIQSVYKVK